MSRDLPGRGGWEVLELTGTLRRRISECRLSQLRRDLGVKQEQKKGPDDLASYCYAYRRFDVNGIVLLFLCGFTQ